MLLDKEKSLSHHPLSGIVNKPQGKKFQQVAIFFLGDLLSRQAQQSEQKTDYS